MKCILECALLFYSTFSNLELAEIVITIHDNQNTYPYFPYGSFWNYLLEINGCNISNMYFDTSLVNNFQ